MKTIWRTVRFAACGLVAVGIVLAFAGYALSGFDSRVFSATVDRGEVTLGGIVIDDPSALPIISTIAEMGRIEYGAASGEGNSQAPDAPTAPDAPIAPEVSEE